MAWYKCIGNNSGGTINVSQVVNKRAQSPGDTYDSSMFYISGKNGTDFSEVLWTYTATEKVQICFGVDSQARTNTSGNEGYISVVINNTTELKQVLTTDTLVNLTLGDYEINSGDTISLVAGFNNSHTNCWWQVYTAVAIISNAINIDGYLKKLGTVYIDFDETDPSRNYCYLSTDQQNWTPYYYGDIGNWTTFSIIQIRYSSPYWCFKPINSQNDVIFKFDDKYYNNEIGEIIQINWNSTIDGPIDVYKIKIN